MEDIRLYDFNAKLLHVENDIISANWTIYYNGIGTFEGHFDLNSDILPILMEQPYLILMQGDKQAIITGKQCAEDFTLYGKTLNWMLSRRATASFTTANLPQDKSVASIAHWVVGNAFDLADHLICQANQNQFKQLAYFWSNTMQATSDVIADCCMRDYAGHKLSFDQNYKSESAPFYKGRWVFEVIKGKTIPLIISTSSRNAFDMEYQEDMQKFYNGGWYELEGETGDRVWTSIPSTESGIFRWMGILRGNMQTQAMSDLQKKKWEKTVLTKTKGLTFSFDYSEESYLMGEYHLGDTLKVQKEFGKYKMTEEKRVVGIDFWYENNNIGVQPILETDGPLPEEVA